MSLSEHEEPTKPKEEKPLTPEEQAQKAFREEQQKINRGYYEKVYQGRNVFRFRKSDGTPAEKEEAADLGVASIQAGHDGIPTFKKMTEGWWDLFEVREPGKEVEYDKFKVPVYVDKNDGIRPGAHVDVDNPYAFGRVWTQIIRGYTAGIGINRLKLDYPNCYLKDDAGNRVPDPEKYKLIDLKGALRILRIAEKEGAAMHLREDSALAARLANPKNKKDAKMCAKVREQFKKTQENLASKTELNKRQSELSHAFHADGLKTDSAALKTKSEELKAAKDADIPAKIKEVEEARAKIHNRLDEIEKIDFNTYTPSADLSKKYEAAIAGASKAIDEASNALKDKTVPEKDKPEFEKLAKGLDALKKRADGLGNKADLNGIELPKDRAEAKAKDLEAKMNALTQAVDGLKNVAPLEKDKALTAVKTAFEDVARTVKDIKTETTKPNTKEELKKYEAAINKANAILTDTQLNDKILQPPTAEESSHKIFEEMQIVRTNLTQEVDGTLKDLNNKINPPSRQDVAKDKLINDENRISKEDNIGKLNLLAEYTAEDKKAMNKIGEKMKELEKKLKDVDKLTPDKVEEIQEEFKNLEEEKDILDKRSDAFRDVRLRIPDEKNLQDKKGKVIESANKLSDTSKEIGEFKDELKEKVEGLARSRPTPGNR